MPARSYTSLFGGSVRCVYGKVATLCTTHIDIVATHPLHHTNIMYLPCSTSQLNNLYDMQHMWYELRAGDAHLAAGALGRALKQYVAVAKHFADFAGMQSAVPLPAIVTYWP